MATFLRFDVCAEGDRADTVEMHFKGVVRLNKIGETDREIMRAHLRLLAEQIFGHVVMKTR